MFIRLLHKSLKFIEKFSNKYFFSVLKREKYSEDINALPDISLFNKKVSIVMTGLIIEDEDFTLETLKLYKKRYPSVQLILSTWNYYEKSLISKFTNIGVEVVLNSEPDNIGFGYVNSQIKSNKMGILKAKESGNEYCLKTRTDQRIYKHDFILYLISLVKLFPLKSNSNNKPKERLITISTNTFKYRLYGVNDMFMFGNINDILSYWNTEYDQRHMGDKYIAEIMNNNATVLEYSKANICEVYLCTQYLKNINHKINYSFKDYWKILADYFCIVDSYSIDFFWYKYNRWDERKRYQNINRKLNEEFMFSDWINSYYELIQYTDSDEEKLFKLNME